MKQLTVKKETKKVEGRKRQCRAEHSEKRTEARHNNKSKTGREERRGRQNQEQPWNWNRINRIERQRNNIWVNNEQRVMHTVRIDHSRRGPCSFQSLPSSWCSGRRWTLPCWRKPSHKRRTIWRQNRKKQCTTQSIQAKASGEQRMDEYWWKTIARKQEKKIEE